MRSSSKILGIKYTTGKALIQKYRRRGNIDRVRGRRSTNTDFESEIKREKLIENMKIFADEDSTPV